MVFRTKKINIYSRFDIRNLNELVYAAGPTVLNFCVKKNFK